MLSMQPSEPEKPIAIIMMGLPGSGKTTWLASYISSLAEGPNQLHRLVECSADHYYIEHPSADRRDAKTYPKAHAQCMKRYVEACRDGVAMVTCDNCNVTPHALAPYVAIARAYDYDVRIIFCSCDPNVAFSRQRHGVPQAEHNFMRGKLRELMNAWPGIWPEFGVVKTDATQP